MKKQIAIVLLASSLTSCISGADIPYLKPVVVSELERVPLQLVFHSTFPKPGTLIDLIHSEPRELEVGLAKEGETASGDLTTGVLRLFAPWEPWDSDALVPSVGFFSRDRNFGQGTAFSVRATFQKPTGPGRNSPTKSWAVGVAARNGDLDDPHDLKRISATLRSKGTRAATFNIGSGATEATKPPAADIGPMYSLIFDDHKEFTIDLYVDRIRGYGIATLSTAGADTMSLRFEMEDFKKDDGEPITTVGATLTDCCQETTASIGASFAVNVTDFQIWARAPTQ